MDAQIQRWRESEIEGGREREKGGWRTDKLSERERWLVQGGVCVCVCVWWWLRGWRERGSEGEQKI